MADDGGGFQDRSLYNALCASAADTILEDCENYRAVCPDDELCGVHALSPELISRGVPEAGDNSSPMFVAAADAGGGTPAAQFGQISDCYVDVNACELDATTARLGQEVLLSLRKAFGDQVPQKLQERARMLLPSSEEVTSSNDAFCSVPSSGTRRPARSPCPGRPVSTQRMPAPLRIDRSRRGARVSGVNSHSPERATANKVLASGVPTVVARSRQGSASPQPSRPRAKQSVHSDVAETLRPRAKPSCQPDAVVFGRLYKDSQERLARQGRLQAGGSFAEEAREFSEQLRHALSKVSQNQCLSPMPSSTGSNSAGGRLCDRLHKEAQAKVERRQQMAAKFNELQSENLRLEAQRAIDDPLGRGSRGRRSAFGGRQPGVQGRVGGAPCPASVHSGSNFRPRPRSWSPVRGCDYNAEPLESCLVVSNASDIGNGNCCPVVATGAPLSGGQKGAVRLLPGTMLRAGSRSVERNSAFSDVSAVLSAEPMEDCRRVALDGVSSCSGSSLHLPSAGVSAPHEIEAVRRDIFVMRKQLGRLMAGADILRRQMQRAEARVHASSRRSDVAAPLAANVVDAFDGSEAASDDFVAAATRRSQSASLDEAASKLVAAAEYGACGVSALDGPVENLVHSASPQPEDSPEVPQKYWVVKLERSEGGRLGIDVDEDSEGRLFVKVVSQGDAVDKWNRTNPDVAIEPGDLIVEVNGRRKDLIAECRNERFLSIVVFRRIS
eukprot:TRINITY_DN23422_c0_g4_i1.p1 TRINITY_DN23422_c0_g4~~TRINITY_DN23422_c0_g4_i1.p1  ORF type:complete len:726 (+),score=88.21 TRINITY_DN23422_c0_g4_i1:82-2259(+)